MRLPAQLVIIIIYNVYECMISTRDVHGNGIPNETGNPMGIPWEWE